MTDRHTVRSYDADLKTLTSMILRTGELVSQQFGKAMDALLTGDRALAEGVVAADAQVDALERDIHDQALRLLALRQPMADDLRLIASAFKIAADLERIGDYAANIGKRALVLERLEKTDVIARLEPMATAAREILQDTLEAYAGLDMERAMIAWSKDKPLDKLYESLLQTLSSAMMDNPEMIGAGAHLMFIARNIERIGDHATNIAENTYFIISGLPLRMIHPRGKVETNKKQT